MAKDTVRYPDELVAQVDELVADGVFESKSEFYRFSAEYVLELLAEDHEATTFNYADIKQELGIDPGRDRLAVEGDGGTPFFESVIAVRKYGLRGDFDAAEEFIDNRYESTDRECMLLEELLGTYRRVAGSDEE
ncbi:CopG family transcriptional regulator [Halobacteriales archaeon SW_7_68_16]|nr:MAG: CopG family transcriptional regulator [Halobacteriales archaeon SW_7_68_16]